MFGWFTKNKTKFRKKSLAELRDTTRILFIDDEETDLVDSLREEGWHIKYLEDLDRYNNIDLIDAHIVCIDIKGVGKKLNIPEEGLGLIRNIKEHYPEKKMILHSSYSTHDIFDNAIDLVDKKIYKDGQTHPFDTAFKELSQKLFDWDFLIKDIYYKYKNEFSTDLTLQDFNKKMQSSIEGSEISVQKILNITTAGLKVVNEIKNLLKPFV